MSANENRPVRGGCHCGRVAFEVDLPPALKAFRCNCSICARTGFVHVFVERNRFRLIQGKEELTEYRFHTGVARHLFCRVCGVKSFYVPRSHPEGFSVNLHCLELDPAQAVECAEFDGRHWSRSIAELRSQAEEKPR